MLRECLDTLYTVYHFCIQNFPGEIEHFRIYFKTNLMCFHNTFMNWFSLQVLHCIDLRSTNSIDVGKHYLVIILLAVRKVGNNTSTFLNVYASEKVYIV